MCFDVIKSNMKSKRFNQYNSKTVVRNGAFFLLRCYVFDFVLSFN